MTASSLKILLAIVACIAVFLFFVITYNSPQTLIFSFQELHRRESCYSNFVSKCTYIWRTNNMYIFTINVDWHVSMHLETWYWLVTQCYLVLLMFTNIYTLDTTYTIESSNTYNRISNYIQSNSSKSWTRSRSHKNPNYLQRKRFKTLHIKKRKLLGILQLHSR